jgi:potassium-dependent mechanosensitive channel
MNRWLNASDGLVAGVARHAGYLETLETTWGDVRRWADLKLFSIKGVAVTPVGVVLFFGTLLAGLFLGRLARSALLRVLTRSSDAATEGSAYAVARIVQYVITAGAAFLALDNVGISMASLAALGAVFAVGLGFGLQTIAQNFISGIILLFERPVAKGDVVIVDGTFGVVDEISIRATRIMTFDHIAMIVPNSKLISGVVENRSEPTTEYRIRVGVGVAYGSDTRKVERLLLEVASQPEAVLKEPAPSVFFVDFGSSSLDFQLCVWLDDPEAAWTVGSTLRHEIAAAFRRHGIEIPFPQRDVHIKTPAALPAPKD